MLMPKRTKHRKMFRGRMKGTAQRGNTVAFGDYGLQALEPHWITNRQIESCRVAINLSLIHIFMKEKEKSDILKVEIKDFKKCQKTIWVRYGLRKYEVFNSWR